MNPPADPRDPHAHDDPIPGDDTDALVSAYLDGEASPDEMARVQGDPALRERLEQFRAVRDAVAGGIEAPTLLLDDQVSRALAGGREPGATGPVESSAGGAGGDGGRVVDLEAARDRRRRAGVRMLGAVAAVAALVLLVVSMPGLLGGGDEAGDNMAASIVSDEMADGASGAEAEFAGDGAAADAAEEAMSGDDASPAAAETGLYRSNGDGAESPLVILPLASDLVDGDSDTGDSDTGATVEQSNAPSEDGTDWPTDLGRFATRNETRSAVTATVAAVLATVPPSTESFWSTRVEPRAGACLSGPPLGAESLGLEDLDAPVVFVGRFDQAGDERYVVVLRPSDGGSRARVLEVQAATCTLLGVQDL